MNPLLKIPPAVYGLLLLGLGKWLAGELPLTWWPTAKLTGAGLASLGIALVFWAWLHFVKHKTTPIPTGEASFLVVSGPYRFTRNPMYLGFLLLFSGAALYLGHLGYWLSPLGVFLIADRLFIPFEEARLTRLFGAAFGQFQARVRRWL